MIWARRDRSKQASAAFGASGAAEDPSAAVSRAKMLSEQGDVEGARSAYQQAIDSKDPEYAPAAAFQLGILLGRNDDREGAKEAYRQAVNSGHPEHSPVAARNLGHLYKRQGRYRQAVAAYQIAIESGHPDVAPWAMVYLGNLLSGFVDTRRREPPTRWPWSPGTRKPRAKPRSAWLTCPERTAAHAVRTAASRSRPRSASAMIASISSAHEGRSSISPATWPDDIRPRSALPSTMAARSSTGVFAAISTWPQVSSLSRRIAWPWRIISRQLSPDTPRNAAAFTRGPQQPAELARPLKLVDHRRPQNSVRHAVDPGGDHRAGQGRPPGRPA